MAAPGFKSRSAQLKAHPVKRCCPHGEVPPVKEAQGSLARPAGTDGGIEIVGWFARVTG